MELVEGASAGDDAEAAGTCCEGGFDADGRIFEDDAACGWQAETCGCLEEHIGVWLAADDIGAGDDGVNEVRGIESGECGGDVFGRTAGADGHGNAGCCKFVDQPGCSRHVGKVAGDQFAIEEFFFFIEGGDGGIIGWIVPCVANDFAAGATKAGEELFFGAFAAMSAAALLPCFQVCGVGVDQNAIHIEDDAEGRVGVHVGCWVVGWCQGLIGRVVV